MKMSKAEKNKARYIELNTLKQPLSEKEETELRFLEKQLEAAERIAQFKKNQAEPYASKRSRAVNLAWEFYRNIDEVQMGKPRLLGAVRTAPTKADKFNLRYQRKQQKKPVGKK